MQNHLPKSVSQSTMLTDQILINENKRVQTSRASRLLYLFSLFVYDRNFLPTFLSNLFDLLRLLSQMIVFIYVLESTAHKMFVLVGFFVDMIISFLGDEQRQKKQRSMALKCDWAIRSHREYFIAQRTMDAWMDNNTIIHFSYCMYTS